MLRFMGLQRVGHDGTTELKGFIFCLMILNVECTFFFFFFFFFLRILSVKLAEQEGSCHLPSDIGGREGGRERRRGERRKE